MLCHVYAGSGFGETLFVFTISKDSVIAILVSNGAVVDCFCASIAHVRCLVKSIASFLNEVRTSLIAGWTSGTFDTAENDFSTGVAFFTMISVNTEVVSIVEAAFMIPITKPVQLDFF